MFMFVFAIILISLVGLFLQIVNALTMFLASQQMGMGQQIILWHNLAKEYACTSGVTPGVPLVLPPDHLTANDPALGTAIHNVRPEYKGRNWSTAIFSGTIGGAASTLVLSYIPNNSVFYGIPSAEVVRQFRASFKNNEYRFSATYSGASPTNGVACPGPGLCMDIVVSDLDSNPYPIVVTGIPAAVTQGVSGIINAVDLTKCGP
jgi:hypothetical protein